MVAKITVTGKRVSPITTMKDFHRFEMLEGGSPSAPKGLPLASSVLYSIFIGLKQGKAIDLLNLPENQLFSIAGEVSMEIPKIICPGRIGVIAFNAKLIDLKDKKPKTIEELPNSSVAETKIVQEVTSVVDVHSHQSLPALRKHDAFDPELEEKQHLMFNRTCTFCSAKIDKRLGHIKLIDPNKPSTVENRSLVCPDCINDRPNPALDGFSIGPKAVVKFQSLGMDAVAIVEFLSDFIHKFVLVNISETLNFREYWVPRKQPIFKFKVVNNIITDLQIAKDRITESN